MKKLLFYFTIITMISACKVGKGTSNCQETKDGSAACERIYRPVCGCNGKTYSNDCVAESYGITEYTSGKCE